MDAKTKVDIGEELYLLKENIKPLKKGRMICQLRTALLAQDDETAHHELLKQREKYEMLLRSYEGSDRLEPWYEYILWVEQSFLGDSREGNLYVLLERCLACLAEDEGYLQDRRYIELWIKYIELSINPLEVYKQCHAHGIGKHCAFFYMSWAFEFEKTGDFKRADQVFSEGFRNSSQPIDELEEAHKNFQLRVARQVLSGSSDVEAACIEQRVALSKLKAHGHKKNVVGSVRVGSNVQRGSAGVLQSITQHGSNSSNVQTNPIEVSSGQEDDTSAEFSVLRRVHMSSIPRREILNKENLLKPGPWNGKPRNNCKVAVLSRPQQPPFELYRDDEVCVENSPLVICNALKPRKLDDEGFKCAVALFEPEDPSKCPIYCKNKVYAGVTEFSFEELRAIEYLKGNRPARCKPGRKMKPAIIPFIVQHNVVSLVTIASLFEVSVQCQECLLEHSKRHLWEQFFYTLLNVEPCDKLPDVSELRHLVEAEILSNKHFSDLTPVRNVLGGNRKKLVN